MTKPRRGIRRGPKRCSACGKPGHDRRTCGRTEKTSRRFDPWRDLTWREHHEARAIVRSFPDGLTLEAVGSIIGVTRERVRQIESSALRKLRNGIDLADAVVIDGVVIPLTECDRCGSYFVRKARQKRCDACLGIAEVVPLLEDGSADDGEPLEFVDPDVLLDYAEGSGPSTPGSVSSSSWPPPGSDDGW